MGTTHLDKILIKYNISSLSEFVQQSSNLEPFSSTIRSSISVGILVEYSSHERHAGRFRDVCHLGTGILAIAARKNDVNDAVFRVSGLLYGGHLRKHCHLELPATVRTMREYTYLPLTMSRPSY